MTPSEIFRDLSFCAARDLLALQLSREVNGSTHVATRAFASAAESSYARLISLFEEQVDCSEMWMATK